MKNMLKVGGKYLVRTRTKDYVGTFIEGDGSYIKLTHPEWPLYIKEVTDATCKSVNITFLIAASRIQDITEVWELNSMGDSYE